MLYYVDKQGVCSHLKPAPRIKAGVVSSQVGGQEIQGFHTLENLHWFAHNIANRLQTRLLGV